VQLVGGHTNESFALDADRVERRSWPGKLARQISDEARVLDALAGQLSFDTPRILEQTFDGERFTHVFSRCRGSVGPRYLAPSQSGLASAAMRALRELHTALASLPSAATDAWAWLARKLDAVGPSLPPHGDRVLARIARVIPAAAATTQWLHGDYQLGNLLWDGDAVSAVVDFDDTCCGSPASEATMAAFALSRQPVETQFRFDRALWDAAITAYDSSLALDPAPFVDVFCAYQVLVHLLAAQRGLWTLDAGIGFWPCWNTLLAEQ
jgi:Ser/Thr protein kinase RdoA (MazF antagonist)